MPKFIEFIRIALAIVGILLLSACAQTQLASKAGKADYSHYPQGGGLFVASTFDQQGRLWRVVPEKEYVYVDYSTDLGKTFEAPIRINKDPQAIKVSGENPPNIAIDNAGRIYVIYAAEGAQPVTVYSSTSIDGGLSFSTPTPISDKASEANSFQARLAMNHLGEVYAFWHDERDRTDWRQLGNSVYYTRIDENNRVYSQAFKVSDMFCECCHVAIAFDRKNQPVVFARFIYDGGVRDHGLIIPAANSAGMVSKRTTFDNWQIEACPEHGPALTIDDNDHFHIAWFTQGSERKGLFYANSTDQGQHFSQPLGFGSPGKLASHPDVMAVGQHVVIVWLEFDGIKTDLKAMQSHDGGKSWDLSNTVAESAAANNHPSLLNRAGQIFVAWNSVKQGYRLIAIN